MSVYGNQTVKVLKYGLLPQVLPRISELFFTGSAYFAFFIAQVYAGVRLLPVGHPYTHARNVGHFNTLDVIAQAGKNLRYRRENIDQVILYYVILVGLFLLVVQALMMAANLIPGAMAAVLLGEFFGTSNYVPYANGEQDLAFILLDRVFGVPGIFDSCVSQTVACFRSTGTMGFGETVYAPTNYPWPFHEALQAMFQFYSIGLLVIAGFVLLYFVVVIIAETAQTGVPFGKRFNTVWAPLRMIVGIGLLVPVGFGLNSAQYIVLYAAKYGSNFATNGWLAFNSELSSGHMFEGMIAKPQKPDVNGFLKFMMLAHACKAIEEGYLISNTKAPTATGACASSVSPKDQTDTIINAYLVKKGPPNLNSMLIENTNYMATLGFFDSGSFTIRFGDRGCTADHAAQLGNVKPLCGELVLPQNALKDAGAMVMQEGYYNLVRHLWGEYDGKVWPHWGFCTDAGVNSVVDNSGDELFKIRSLYHVQALCPDDVRNKISAGVKTPQLTSAKNIEPDADWVNEVLSAYIDGDVCNDPQYASGTPGKIPPVATTGASVDNVIENIIRMAIYAEIQSISGAQQAEYSVTEDLLARGWAGAGLWYNRIAEANGALTGSAWKAPQISKWPTAQTNIMIQKKMNDEATTIATTKAPNQSGTTSLTPERGKQEAQAAGALYKIDRVWDSASMHLKPKSGNVVFDFMNWLFGTRGLFDLKDPVNQQTHPLALMTSLGKSLVEASIRNLGLALGGQVGAMLESEVIGPTAEGFSSLMYTAATMTLTAGFILYYVLPFLPFVYFFFAVGNWVKGIFEAIVGVPLWALAHIRIDGDGLPGSAALNGYFMIFEIFLRPILIVFGLVAAVSIFAAMAIVFNSVFDLAVYNVGGADLTNAVCGNALAGNVMDNIRGPIDQFFYTIMYAVVLYIMALSSFKLIDLIPNKILRWMGASVDTFGDMAGDPAQNLTNYAAIGGSQMTSGMINSLRGGVGAIGKGVEGVKKLADD